MGGESQACRGAELAKAAGVGLGNPEPEGGWQGSNLNSITRELCLHLHIILFLLCFSSSFKMWKQYYPLIGLLL